MLVQKDRYRIIKEWLKGKTYKEIGEGFGVTGERIRQIILQELKRAKLIGGARRKLRRKEILMKLKKEVGDVVFS